MNLEGFSFWSLQLSIISESRTCNIKAYKFKASHFMSNYDWSEIPLQSQSTSHTFKVGDAKMAYERGMRNPKENKILLSNPN